MKVKFKTAATKLANNKVFYDPSFQRRVVWDNIAVSKFISSATKEWLKHTCITLASVDECLAHSKEVADTYSIKYFQNLKDRDYKYVSIDGQNRTKKLVGFMTNKFPISGDDFVDADGEITVVSNKHFKDFPERLGDRIKDCGLNVCIFEDVTREDCSEIFVRTNENQQPNAQALRQAKTTPIADWVRFISEENRAALKQVVDPKACKEMLDDELIAKVAMIVTNTYDSELLHAQAQTDDGLSISRSAIDKWYSIGQGFYDMDDINCPYNSTGLVRTKEIIDQVSMVLTRQRQYAPDNRIPMSMFWATVYACRWVHNNSYIISDMAGFFKAVGEIEDTLKNQSLTAYAKARQDAISQKKDPKGISEGHYYYRQVALNHQPWSRGTRVKELEKALSAHIITPMMAGIIKKVSFSEEVA